MVWQLVGTSDGLNSLEGWGEHGIPALTSQMPKIIEFIPCVFTPKVIDILPELMIPLLVNPKIFSTNFKKMFYDLVMRDVYDILQKV